MTSEELFEKVSELIDKTFKYKPISEKEAVGKTIEKVYTLYNGWNDNYKVITFTDKTALYYECDKDPERHPRLVTSYGDIESGINVYLSSLGSSLYDEGLLNDTTELLKAEEQYRLAFLEENRQEQIRKLKEILKQLENES